MKFNLVDNGELGANITVFIDGEMYVANAEHPNWHRIVRGAIDGDETIVELFDAAQTIMSRFERLSDRVTVSNGKLFFDGDEMNSALSQQILRFLEEGEDFQPLVEFYEKVSQNPNEHSREQLYGWLNTHDFTITRDGNIVGYKGVRSDGSSIFSGPAVVDGESVNGHVPNPVGAIVEMPRGKVIHDPTVGCSYGLHVGTWDYASSFSQGLILKLSVNPRDVVSVPTDCNWAKMRVCRYEVLDTLEAPVTRAVDYSGEDDFEEHYGYSHDYCEWCDSELDGDLCPQCDFDMYDYDDDEDDVNESYSF